MAHGHTKSRINKIHLFTPESKILLMESVEIQTANIVFHYKSES